MKRWIVLVLAASVALLAAAFALLNEAIVRLDFHFFSVQLPLGVVVTLSLLVGFLLASAALFIYWQVSSAAHGGRYPAGVFSGYAAGIGVMIVQALLVRRVERLPQYAPYITEPG